jgi:hypothetical protein
MKKARVIHYKCFSYLEKKKNCIFTTFFYRIMNTVAVAIALALLVTVSSGLGYNSNNRYPSISGNSLNSRGSIGESLFDNGGWDRGHQRGYGSEYYFPSV